MIYEATLAQQNLAKGGYLPNKNLKFKKTTREKFNTVVSQLKDSLTF